jgi:hypothetical protein
VPDSRIKPLPVSVVTVDDRLGASRFKLAIMTVPAAESGDDPANGLLGCSEGAVGSG